MHSVCQTIPSPFDLMNVEEVMCRWGAPARPLLLGRGAAQHNARPDARARPAYEEMLHCGDVLCVYACVFLGNVSYLLMRRARPGVVKRRRWSGLGSAEAVVIASNPHGARTTSRQTAEDALGCSRRRRRLSRLVYLFEAGSKDEDMC